MILGATSRPADALESHQRALAIRERLAQENPEVPIFASAVGGSLNNIAEIDLQEGRSEAAREKFHRAIVAQKQALAANPSHPGYRRFLSNHLTGLIRAAEKLGRAAEAAEASTSFLIFAAQTRRSWLSTPA